jgi:hypothetical protein
MLGCKTRDFKQHESISLEDLVPEDNFYRPILNKKNYIHWITLPV